MAKNCYTLFFINLVSVLFTEIHQPYISFIFVKNVFITCLFSFFILKLFIFYNHSECLVHCAKVSGALRALQWYQQ